MNKFFNAFAIFTIGCVAAATLTGCDARKEWVKSEGAVWATSYHITYQGEEALSDSVIPVLNRVGASLSMFDPTSLVTRVNRGETAEVDSDFIAVYNMSRKIHTLSNGSFDPTVLPIVEAWGFGPSHTASADTARIDSLLNFVGIDKTAIKGATIIKTDPRIKFDFSAIAKGYGCDAVAQMLAQHGVTNLLVEIGGEISTRGLNPEGGKWRISIDKPIFSADRTIHDSQVIIAIQDCGVATSGNYRNFKETPDGQRYGHTISPTTGRPAITDVLSATVIAPTCMEADGLATALMAAGSANARKIAAASRCAVMLVLADGSVWESDSFKQLIVK